MMKRRASVLLAAVAATLTVVATDTASAQSVASCSVASTSCTTGVVRANGAGHFIDVGVLTSIPRGANWFLWDYDIGRVVASGHIERNTDFSRRIGGLYGQYALQVTDSLWDTTAVIDNG